jgi:DNA-binding transcriptional LysR family regulator
MRNHDARAPEGAGPASFRPLRISSRQIVLLNALDLHGSLHRAAEAMHTTQPAATALLKQLEQSLNVTLFERHSRGMRPTPYGEVMIRYARGVLHDYEHADDEIIALSRGAAGLVRVGSVTGAVPTLLAPSLAAFKAANPRMRIAVEVDTSDLLMPGLVNGDLDIVLGRLPDQFANNDLEIELFEGEPMSVVARPGHKLFDARVVRLADLVPLTWILHPSGSPMRRRVEAALQGASVATALDIIETSSILATTAMLESTDMISVVPLEVARHYAKYGLIGILPVELPVAMVNLGIITRRTKGLSPATKGFLHCLRETIRAGKSPRERRGKRPGVDRWGGPR